MRPNSKAYKSYVYVLLCPCCRTRFRRVRRSTRPRSHRDSSGTWNCRNRTGYVEWVGRSFRVCPCLWDQHHPWTAWGRNPLGSECNTWDRLIEIDNLICKRRQWNYVYAARSSFEAELSLSIVQFSKGRLLRWVAKSSPSETNIGLTLQRPFRSMSKHSFRT